jgi:hypothetical protein
MSESLASELIIRTRSLRAMLASLHNRLQPVRPPGPTAIRNSR